MIDARNCKNNTLSAILFCSKFVIDVSLDTKLEEWESIVTLNAKIWTKISLIGIT